MWRSLAEMYKGSPEVVLASPPVAAWKPASVRLFPAAAPSHCVMFAAAALNRRLRSEAVADQPVAAALVFASATWKPVPPERVSARMLLRRVIVAVLFRLKA